MSAYVLLYISISWPGRYLSAMAVIAYRLISLSYRIASTRGPDLSYRIASLAESDCSYRVLSYRGHECELSYRIVSRPESTPTYRIVSSYRILLSTSGVIVGPGQD